MPVVVYHPRFRFCPPVTAIQFQGLRCADTMDGDTNALKCKITPRLIICSFLLLALDGHLSFTGPCVCAASAYFVPFSTWERFVKSRAARQTSPCWFVCFISTQGEDRRPPRGALMSYKPPCTTLSTQLTDSCFFHNIYWLFYLYLHAVGDLSMHLILVQSNLTSQILITSKAKRTGALSTSGKDKEWFCCVDHPSIPEVSSYGLIIHICVSFDCSQPVLFSFSRSFSIYWFTSFCSLFLFSCCFKLWLNIGHFTRSHWIFSFPLLKNKIPLLFFLKHYLSFSSGFSAFDHVL